MDINFLRARRNRKRSFWRTKIKEAVEFFLIATLGSPIWLVYFTYQGAVFTRDYLRGNDCILYIICTEEQTPAVQFSLKTLLELPYVEFQRLERRVPGPLFRGSREALEWLAEGLRAERIPCRVRRVFPWTLAKLERFYYPVAQNLSIADACKDNHEIYLEQERRRIAYESGDPMQKPMG